MLELKNHFDISDSIEIREVDIAGVTCIYVQYRSVTYVLWYSDSALHFFYYLMNRPHSLDIGSDMDH